jgi:hypothetical protein
MTSDPNDPLERNLLGLLLHNPKRVLVLAMCTGMAVAYELASSPARKDVLHKLNVDHVVCERACELILRHWVERVKAGDVNEAQFRELVSGIVKIARAS